MRYDTIWCGSITVFYPWPIEKDSVCHLPRSDFIQLLFKTKGSGVTYMGPQWNEIHCMEKKAMQCDAMQCKICSDVIKIDVIQYNDDELVSILNHIGISWR